MASTPKASAPTEGWIALLGRRDEPTDGVEDYCTFLGQALAQRGVELKKVRVRWREKGRAVALRELWHESAGWRGNWVLLQYTTLGWSGRGFPFLALIVQSVLRLRGAHFAVVLHDGTFSTTPRLRDRIRNEIQMWVVRRLFERAERGVLAAPPEALHWLPSDPTRAVYIPIGANVPEYRGGKMFSEEQEPKTVAVFSVTGGDARSQEVDDILFVMRRVNERIGPVRLEVFGRGTDKARESLQRGLEGSDIELTARGVIPAEEITRTLSAAHVMLCVRGLVTGRRGTAIAGIACGLPVVGYGQPGSDPAI